MTRIALIALLAVTPAHAQEASQPAEAPKAQAAAPKPAPREDIGQAVNIRLELTITDQQTNGAPVVKTLTMVVADNWQTRLRTDASLWNTSLARAIPVTLNVDARPQILGDRILLRMAVEYKPTAIDPKTGGAETTLNQSFQVLLQDGKPLAVSQSADPNSDRKVKLEVKATILRD